MGVLKRKNLLVSILFLCLLLLASLSMAATAKSEASIKVETSLEDSSIKVQIPQGVFQDEDVSIVCFAQGWNQDLSRMEENLGYIQYMDQSVISSKGGTFFVALKDQADKNSIYTLVMSADSLKSPIQKQFSFGENTVEVTFDANGGNVSPETSLINKGSTVRLPEAVRTNFYFGGWTTEDGTEVTSESVFQEDTTLYAKWNPYTLENWQDYYATSGWETVDLGTGNTGKQVAEFEIQPLDGRQDGAIYLTGRDAVLNDWGDGPVVIRLNTDGYFDARNGAAFEMTSQVSYQAGETYHLKAIIDVDAKKYTVLVTAPDGKEQVVAQDFVFRTGAKEIQDIGKICIRCGSGSVQGRFIVRNLSLKPYEEPAVEKYTVSLDANGGTVTPQSMEVVKGETLQLPVPVREDYEFKGWYTAAEGGVQVTGQEPVTGNCTLYARWERKGPVAWLPYTSTADWSSIDLGEGHTGEQTILLTVKPLEDKQDGIIFYTGRNARLEDWGHAPIAFRLNPDGYFDARNGEEYKMDNRIAYVAGKSYQVKIAADIAKKKYDVYITDESGKEQCLAKDYAFRTGAQEISDIGKLCARSGNGAAAGKFVIEKHEMQNGIQQEISYTITYDANGGQVIPQSQTVKEGEKPTLPEPEREGYEFKGWYTQAEGGSQVTAQTVVTGDCTIYAHWEKKEVTDPEKYCTITYDANGGKVTPQSQTVKEGEKLTLPEPEREGYEFKGWYTQAEGGSQVTAQTAVTGDCTIYAHWEKKVVVEPEKYYTITYDANGGKVTPQSQTVKEGSAIRLPMPTRSGYTFKGWYTAKSGGVKFADNTVAAEDTILYARWEKKAPKPLKKGERFNVGKFKYKVLSPSSGKKTGKAVVLGYAKSNKDKSLTVADIVTAPSGRGKFRVTEIASNAFKGNKRLATVKIGKYVASVGKSAFAKCKAIRTIKGGRGIKVIGASAFSQCTSLKTFTVGKNVTEIKEKAFYGCKKVSSLTIRSAKLKKIGSKAITGMKENAAIKVPAKKKAAYKKLFHAKTGYKKTMKIKS